MFILGKGCPLRQAYNSVIYLAIFFNVRSIAGKGGVTGVNTEQRTTVPWHNWAPYYAILGNVTQSLKCWQQIGQKENLKKAFLFSLSNFCKGWYFKTALHWIHELRISLDASLILHFGSMGLCFFILYSFYDCGVSLGSDPVPIISTCRKHVHAGKSSCSRASYDGNAPRPQNANIKKKKKKKKKKKTPVITKT